MDPRFSSHRRRETRSLGFLLAAFLQIISLASDDPNAAGAPPEDEAVELDIDPQLPSMIRIYKRRNLAEEDSVPPPLPPSPPPPPPPSELHQPRTLQQIGGNPVNDSDELESSCPLGRRIAPPMKNIPSLERRQSSLKDNKESEKEKIEGSTMCVAITVPVSAGAMVGFLPHSANHWKYNKITSLVVSMVLFLASLVAGLSIAVLSSSAINIPLWLAKSIKHSAYFLLVFGWLALSIHYMGIMGTIFAHVLLLVTVAAIAVLHWIVDKFEAGA